MDKLTLTKSSTLPVSIDEAKLWCRIDNEDEDDLLTGLILAATSAAEGETNRILQASQIEFRFPLNRRNFTIPTSPVRAVVKVEIEDATGQRTLLTADEYRVMLSDRLAMVRLTTFVALSCRVVITADVGYANAAAVPQAIKQAIAVHVGSAYAGREGQDTAAQTFKNLLAPHRVEIV